MVLLVEVQRILVILHGFDLTSTDVRKTLIRENQNSIVRLRTRRTYVFTIICSTARNVHMYTRMHFQTKEFFNQSKCSHYTYSQVSPFTPLLKKSWNEFQPNHARTLRVRQFLLPCETTDETTLQRTLQMRERTTQRSVIERTELVKVMT